MTRTELAKRIDHTLLGPTASADGVRALCAEAVEHGVATVCVNPCHVSLAKSLLAGHSIPVCAVIGFPHGMTTPKAKACEAADAIALGAMELDMVANVGALKDGNLEAVESDIRAVCDAARSSDPAVHVKVILETSLLTDEEKETGARLAKKAGAHFVKTSTGFGPHGATVEDVALLRRVVGDEMGVKAAGGIRDAETALAMIDAGATRIGASRTGAILAGVPDEPIG